MNIEGSEEFEANTEIPYNHINADTPVGEFSVQWKGWEEWDSKCVYLNDKYLNSFCEINEAKEFVNEYLIGLYNISRRNVMKEQLDKWMTEYLYLLEREEDSLERNEMQNKYLHVRRNYDLFCKHLDEGKCFFCSECDVVEHTSKHLVDKCHSCTLWDEREGEHLKTPKLIIDGVMYTDAGNKPNGKYLGFGGTVYTINHKDGTQTITNNLWHSGVIPKKYRLTTMKDNAEFVHENYMYSSTAYKSC